MRRLSISRLFALAFIILALNFFVLGPVLLRVNEIAANVSFILIRVAVLIGFSFTLSFLHGRGRWEIVRLASILEFFDHVVFRGIMMAVDYRTNPVAWFGTEFSQVFMSVAFPFVVFSPAILVLSLIGGEAGRDLRNRRQVKVEARRSAG